MGAIEQREAGPFALERADLAGDLVDVGGAADAAELGERAGPALDGVGAALDGVALDDAGAHRLPRRARDDVVELGEDVRDLGQLVAERRRQRGERIRRGRGRAGSGRRLAAIVGDAAGFGLVVSVGAAGAGVTARR
ncbi:MAG TPA: hypothetical protein VHE35_32830, partial [Kofleriaceae bacterium]|nr:hypothetical protein [Kofleriaceae bacterium]